MARTTPLLRNAQLELPASAGNRPETITAGSRDWYNWLEQNRVFRFESVEGKFTARKEQRPGGWYWYAYRRREGILHISYLGRNQELTLDQLHAVARQLAAQASKSDIAQQGASRTGEALLLTRLTIPQTRTDLLPRPRLLERLQLAASYRLVLFSAPAGYGKTTLLSAWSKLHAGSVAWLTLNESDNDPISFWSYVIAALSSLEAIPPQIPALLHGAQPLAITPVLIMLSNFLSSVTRDLFLVLDDYHLIQAEEIHRALAFLLDSLPAHIHLILAGRVDPPLSLSSLRVAGKLLEIRSDDLRFDAHEARAFLNQQPALHLNDETMSVLVRRTEGWIAGLQLAALSLQGHRRADEFVHGFGGQDRYVLDYLIEEVLLRQPEHVQRFLLRTSILNSLSAPLCDALDESENGQRVLVMLERSNLFVIALDQQRRWYRYHQLFAEALRHRLQQDEPQLIPQLHLRAATWYASQAMDSAAIEHALAAREYVFAAELIERSAEAALLRGETATVANWLATLPAEITSRRPLLSCIAAFALLTRSRFEAVEERLQDAERALATGGMDALTPQDLARIQAMLNVARSTVAINFGHIEPAINHGREALARLDPRDQSLRAIVLHNLGDAYELQGRLTEATEAFERALTLHRQNGNIFVTTTTLGSIGNVQATAGKLHQAEATYRHALELASASLTPDGQTMRLPTAGKALVSLSELHYEWNDLEAAEQTACAGIDLCRQWTHLWHTMQGYLSLARSLLARGNSEQAHHALDQAQKMLDEARATNQQYAQPLLNHRLAWLDERLRAQRASFWIRQGETRQAQLQIEQLASATHPAMDGPFPFVALAQIELLLALHASEQALQQIAPLLENAQNQGWQWLQIDLLVRRMLALAQLHRENEALESLALALKLAEPERYIRIFVDKGAAIIPLLQQAYARSSKHAYIQTLLAAFPEAPAFVLNQGVENLTEREIEVLRLLADGLTNQAIAERLVLAPGTVKWYAHAIYEKLGVHSRTQALAIARQRQLLH